MGFFGKSKDELEAERFQELLEHAGTIADKVTKSLLALRRKRDEREKEMQLRLSKKLSKDLDSAFRREAGIGGTGTRVDLFGCVDNVDIIVSLKKGISEQKVKNLVGEAVIVGSEWQLTNEAVALAHIVHLFDVKEKEVELVNTLDQGLTLVQAATLSQRKRVPVLFHWNGKHALR